ncbi:MAG: ROK family protein [Actinobacteria bacterium]|nr:MAG: ROK family protein [Actinomycetota bacterium]
MKIGKVIAGDIGASKIRVGLVNNQGEVLKRVEEKTPQTTGQAIVEKVIELIKRVDSASKAEAIGLGIAGLVDCHRGIVEHSPNLPLSNFDFVKPIQNCFRINTFIDNDANVSAIGEKVFGSAKKVDNFILLTLGTGIGGAAFINGQIYRGSHGFASEFGHMTVLINGPYCTCGNDGDLEAVASGTALTSMARQVMGSDKITAPMVSQNAKQGDEIAINLLAELGELLGVGIANLINIFDPELVILNGGLSAIGDMLIEPARNKAYNRVLFKNRPLVPIIKGALAEDAGIIGAAALALENVHTT